MDFEAEINRTILEILESLIEVSQYLLVDDILLKSLDEDFLNSSAFMSLSDDTEPVCIVNEADEGLNIDFRGWDQKYQNVTGLVLRSGNYAYSTLDQNDRTIRVDGKLVAGPGHRSLFSVLTARSITVHLLCSVLPDAKNSPKDTEAIWPIRIEFCSLSLVGISKSDLELLLNSLIGERDRILSLISVSTLAGDYRLFRKWAAWKDEEGGFESASSTNFRKIFES